MGTGLHVQARRFRSCVLTTALLAVLATGGSAVAVAATLDPPPAACEAGPGEVQPPPEPSAEEEPLPPGMQRFELPPDPGAPEAAPGPEDVPGEDVPGEDVPAEPAADCQDPLPATPEAAPAARPGAGTPVFSPGMKGRKIEALQVRLQRVGALVTPVTGVYGKQTLGAVKRFQRGLGFVPSGVVDRATLDALAGKAGKVTARDIAAGQNRPYGSRLAASCLTGDVVCVDKTARTVRWIVDGKVKMVLDARFGAEGTPTREGVFSINSKSRDHVSRLYGSSMPFAMFFNGGQAVHYSSDFAARGYYGASHGCVNTRNFKKMQRLFDSAHVGDRVVVYRSRPVKG